MKKHKTEKRRFTWAIPSILEGIRDRKDSGKLLLELLLCRSCEPQQRAPHLLHPNKRTQNPPSLYDAAYACWSTTLCLSIKHLSISRYVPAYPKCVYLSRSTDLSEALFLNLYLHERISTTHCRTPTAVEILRVSCRRDIWTLDTPVYDWIITRHMSPHTHSTCIYI